jgi:hypothetical protein
MSQIDSGFQEPESPPDMMASVRFTTRGRIVTAMWVLSASLIMVPALAWSEIPAHHPIGMNSGSRLDSSHVDLHMYIQPHRGETSHSGQVFFNTERRRKSSLFYNSRRKRIYVPSHGKKQSHLKFSRSILNPTDTLPSFSTAHGLLSPETVMRMDFMTQGSRSEPLEYFFQHYRRNGPMACLPFLSDMSVLPHLTEAMRDITSDE